MAGLMTKQEQTHSIPVRTGKPVDLKPAIRDAVSVFLTLLEKSDLPPGARVALYGSRPVSVQFDLFLHSADVVAENELRDALLAGNAGEAQQKLADRTSARVTARLAAGVGGYYSEFPG